MAMPGGLPTAGVQLEARDLEQFKAQMREANEAVRGMGKDTKQYAKQAEFSLKDLTRAAGIVTGVIVGLGSAAKDLIDTFYDNAQAAGDLSRALQITARDASRVLEVTDDFGVSGEQMRASLRFALSQGVSPTIDGLARLSDEYLSITDDQERARWGTQHLGR